MRPDDHDLMRMADDGCPNHPAAEPDEGIAKLLADTRLHESNLALARREQAKTGETCELPDYEDNGPYGLPYSSMVALDNYRRPSEY